jgi:peptidoglycan DL-endopeptidase CwlO
VTRGGNVKTRRFVVVLFLLALCIGEPAVQAEPSLGEKIKKFFVSPTPTPARKRKHSTSKESPTPTPTPKRKKASPTPEPSETPKHKKSSPTPEPEETPKHKKISPTPEPSETPTPTPKSKKKKKSSPTPTPTESPTPEESPSPSEEESPSASPSPSGKKGVPNATISPNELSGYDDYPVEVRKLVDTSLELTKQNLTYKYGSADPANGGMDCSGFVYYILTQNGLQDVPRDSSQQYIWVRKSGNFRAVVSRNSDTFELDELKPGDLLFWTGTYNIERDPPITHSMIYLGKKKDTDRRIMVGASDGRSFDGIQRFGVSVFDFKLSKPKADKDTRLSPLFVGYGRIPGLREN